MQAIEAQYAWSQNELYGVEPILDDDSDEVVLDIDKDGVKTGRMEYQAIDGSTFSKI